MDLKDVFKALEANENGSAMVEAVKSELAAIRKEAADARVGKNKAETDLAALTQKHGELETKLAEMEKKGAGDQTELQKVQSQVSELSKKLEASEEARKEADAKRIQADIMAQTVDALTKSNAVDPQEFAKLIVPSITVNDDGTYGYAKADGTTGSIADCAADWLSGKAWAVKDAQKPGSGAGTGGGGGDNNTVQAQFEQALGL